MRWVELRVHGVSGAPPESLLGVPHVEQVAGDDYSRFFRPAGAKDDGHVLEGYHWGRFTSGSWRQGFALLLVPFGLVNAAQFMLPRPENGFARVMHLIAGMSLRALGLVLTALFSFTFGLILIDIVAWRWAPESKLVGSRPLWVLVVGGAVLAAVGLVLLAMLGRAGRTRTPPYPPSEHQTPLSTALDPEFFTGNPNAPTVRMLHMAAGLGMLSLLLALTRQADEALEWPVIPIAFLSAVALVVIALGDPERTVTVGFSAPTKWDAVRKRAGRVLLALSFLLLIGEGWRTGHALQDLGSGAGRPTALFAFDHVANRLMLATVLALAVLHAANLLLVWWGKGQKHWTRRDAWVRLSLLVSTLVAAGLVLVVSEHWWITAATVAIAAITVGLAVLASWRVIAPGRTGPRGDEHYFRPFAGGMTPFLLTTLSIFLGVGFSAAAANAVAVALPRGETDKGNIASTEMLDRVGYAWGVTMLEIAGIAILVWIVSRLRRSGYRAKVEEDFSLPAADKTKLPDGWGDRVAKGMFVGQMKNFLPFVVTSFVAVGLVISGVQVFETFLTPDGAVNARWLDLFSQPKTAGSEPVIALGTWLLIAVAGYVVATSRGAIGDSDLRRGINIVWDVFSFWPHAVHPFVPRPYSRWTVIELRNRIRHHLGGPGGGRPAPKGAVPERRVIVTAHSQGSLIAYAALLMLEPHELRQVAFLSCGSQLRVIYPRAFPAYVNLETHGSLFAALGGAWINLYRLTDPLAGPVLSWAHTDTHSRHFPLPPGPGATPDDRPAGEDRCRRCGNDWRLIDPIPHDVDVETGPVTAIHGHHDFWGDPSWPRALGELRGAP